MSHMGRGRTADLSHLAIWCVRSVLRWASAQAPANSRVTSTRSSGSCLLTVDLYCSRFGSACYNTAGLLHSQYFHTHSAFGASTPIPGFGGIDNVRLR